MGKVLAQEPLEGSLAGRETRVSLLIGSQLDKVRGYLISEVLVYSKQLIYLFEKIGHWVK